MSKESSLNRKEMLEEGNLEIQERNKNMINKKYSKIFVFSSSCEVLKLCLMVEEKNVILSDVVLNVCMGNRNPIIS